MISIDDREVTQHPEVRQLFRVPILVQRMEAADYAFLDRQGKPVGIERCEIGNFIQKLRNGELEAQMYKCQEDYESVILLIEGVFAEVGDMLSHYTPNSAGTSFFRSRIETHTRYKEIMASLIRLSEMGIELMFSPSFKCSTVLIETIFEQRRKPEEQHTLFKKLRSVQLPVKLTANPAVPKLLALCPRMPEKVAIRLINKYTTIWGVLNAPDKDLLEIEGMGRGLLTKLKEGIGK